MNKRKAYEQKIDAQFREWDAEIERMKAKAAKADAEAKIKYYEMLEEIERKKADLRKKFDELKQASGEVWEGLVKSVDAAWLELKSAIDRAATRFK